MKNGLKGLKNNLDAVGKIIENVKVAMLTTFDKAGVPFCRPMWAQEVDANGNIWFFSSHKNILIDQIRLNPQVQVTFSDTEKNIYLSGKALATEVQDRKKMKDLWDPHLKTWFPQGLQTQDLILLKLKLEECDFWESASP